MSGSRIDKYLWSIRIFKTRALASEACKRGRVLINDMNVKPSRSVSVGETIQVKKPPVSYFYKVLDPIQKRVGAKIVADYMLDVTPQEELDKLSMQDDFFINRPRGTGRPTKKDRRDLDTLRND